MLGFLRVLIGGAVGAVALSQPALALVIGDPISGVSALPAPVRAAFEKLCPADNWVTNQRDLDGSRTDSMPDANQLYLLVCGSAASSVPYVLLMLSPAGTVREAPINWTFRGKTFQEDGLSNARFGEQLGSVVSRSHVSATCEPAYTHQWDGTAFQLIAVNTKGCRKSDLQ